MTEQQMNAKPVKATQKAASVSEGRFAFFEFDFYLPAVAYGLVFNPVGAAGVGTGVGWFGLQSFPNRDVNSCGRPTNLFSFAAGAEKSFRLF